MSSDDLLGELRIAPRTNSNSSDFTRFLRSWAAFSGEMMEIPRMSGLFFWIQLTLFWVDCFRDSLEDLLVDIFGFLFGAFSSEVLVKAFFGGVRTCFLWICVWIFGAIFGDLKDLCSTTLNHSESKLHKLWFKHSQNWSWKGETSRFQRETSRFRRRFESGSAALKFHRRMWVSAVHRCNIGGFTGTLLILSTKSVFFSWMFGWDEHHGFNWYKLY